MLLAHRVITANNVAAQPSEFVALDFHDRHRRRLRMQTSDDRDFLLDLAEPVALADGDCLLLDDGSSVLVKALPEPVAIISAPDRETLVRIAWHLGNRHLPTEIAGQRLIIRDDHVIVDMVRGLGGDVEQTEAAFQPEGGAYSGEHAHDH